MEIAVLALGCFWGPEIKFSKIEGIIKTEVGYCGGNSPNTSYKEVCAGKTNHAEVVKLDLILWKDWRGRSSWFWWFFIIWTCHGCPG